MPQLVSLNRADVLIPGFMKEFHNLQSSEQNIRGLLPWFLSNDLLKRPSMI